MVGLRSKGGGVQGVEVVGSRGWRSRAGEVKGW